MFTIDQATGLLNGTEFVASPNCDARPHPQAIDLLVIHNVSLPPGEFGGPEIDRLFCNELDIDAHPYFAKLRDLRVSAHLLIRRTGEVKQYVPFVKRAWHAGESCFAGRKACNDFSIAIELEGADDILYTDEQYDVLVAVTKAIRKAYPKITLERVVGHADIAPSRKTDPGSAFDWQRYRNDLGE